MMTVRDATNEEEMLGIALILMVAIGSLFILRGDLKERFPGGEEYEE